MKTSNTVHIVCIASSLLIAVSASSCAGSAQERSHPEEPLSQLAHGRHPSTANAPRATETSEEATGGDASAGDEQGRVPIDERDDALDERIVVDTGDVSIGFDPNSGDDPQDATRIYAPAHQPGEHFATTTRPPLDVQLRVIANDENDVIDIDSWLEENPVGTFAGSVPTMPSSFDGSQFMFLTFGGRGLFAYGDGQSVDLLLYRNERTDSLFAMHLAELDAMYTTIRHAEQHEGVVYLNYANPMSAEANEGDNGYVVAIDATEGSLLWRSEPLRANSYNFIVLGDVLLSGYGFTDEPDYIYAIDRRTGRVIEELRVPTMAEYFSLRETRELDGGQIVYEVAVRTYNRDLVIELRVANGGEASPR